MFEELGTKRIQSKAAHPYLTGNFAPIRRTLPLTPCGYDGYIPDELIGGQYVRNGGNPVTNADLGRDAHWFDGDGMLSGVAFRRLDDSRGRVQPEFVNQYVLTDIYLSTISTPSLRAPILPSIATFVNPLSSIITVFLRILRSVLLVYLSRFSGSQQAIRRISVANTAVLYHDGRALATCESGPPMRVALPGLETVGWFNGRVTEGEPESYLDEVKAPGFGGGGTHDFMREWTTAHPHVDPVTDELILFHSSFIAPYVHYSIVPARRTKVPSSRPCLLGAPVAGMTAAKMMHDFGVSSGHTVILDMPLTLDPMNLSRGEPVVSYDPSGKTRFGVFPRWRPQSARWFETEACCIFHTANTWDEMSLVNKQPRTTAVHMLVCRLNTATLIYETGGITPPVPKRRNMEADDEEEQCRLYYYQFDLSSPLTNRVRHQWALSAVPFEFTSLREDLSMTQARYIYGCSSSDNFTAALGRSVLIDALVKIDARTLIERGKAMPPKPVTGCVDHRTVAEVLASSDPNDPIQVFPMPPNRCAQEPRFVPREDGNSEDDGWLLTYVFDESQLDQHGNAPEGCRSELWVIDARNMRDIVARVYLPQRVPYGLHGSWFSEKSIQSQRPVARFRSLPDPAQDDLAPGKKWMAGFTAAVRRALLRLIG
ncbi:MAG: hypothetical protein M1816_000826 [Peltula sp. TS41687]|nr:MAG: hypothetical protein M1816_000826 [Peltula sp. TS41687]